MGCVVWLAHCVWLMRQGLGVIPFVVSILLTICFFGLRDKFDSSDEWSAHSVFDKGGQAVVGGFAGEQLDRQLRGGAAGAGAANNKASNNRNMDAPLTATTTTAPASSWTNSEEKFRPRCAAAAAAERRLQQHQE